MRICKSIFNSFCVTIVYISIILCVFSCTPQEDKNVVNPELHQDSDGMTTIVDEPEVSFSMQAPFDEDLAERKDFKVVLSVDSMMYLGQSGLMQVWIGEDDIDVGFSKGMSQDESMIPSSLARFAKVTPYAPDFEVKALLATLCYKTDPSGSQITFSLIPKDEGSYKVTAAVELFETEDCTGISVPKSVRALSVSVGVDMKKEISKGIHKMESIAGDKFMIFWVALITLLFGAAIFVIRRYIKNKTGYEEGPTSL